MLSAAKCNELLLHHVPAAVILSTLLQVSNLWPVTVQDLVDGCSVADIAMRPAMLFCNASEDSLKSNFYAGADFKSATV